MERLSKYKEVVTIINNIDSMKVGFHFFDDFGIVKEFKNEDEAIEFMEKEYCILKCECLEEIRKELKAAGLKNISIRSYYFAGGSAIDARLQNELNEKDTNTVKTILCKYDKVDRCLVTGEILSGGNCYVSLIKPNGCSTSIH